MAIVLEDGKSTQIISVMGLPQCDIAYYLARAFNAIKKTVLVVDNSRYHELFKSIPNPDNEKMVQTGDIYYVENIKYSEEFFAQYDFVIVYHGMDIRDELNAASDYRYLITDYSPITTERLRTELDRQEDTLKYHIIYRNKVSGKIQEKMILQELGIPEKNVKESYVMSLNEVDEMCQLLLLRNGSIRTKSCSAEMRDYINAVYATVYPDISTKMQKNYMKAFLSGKIR